LDKLQIRDYEFDIRNPTTLSTYRASVEEILNFASKGTEIALELLNHYGTREETWKTDREIVTTMKRLVDERLTTENERQWGLHFACNSMFLATIVEKYLRGILSRYFDGENNWALSFLHEIEKNGNFDEAVRRFLPVVELNRAFFYQSF
jgi:hypothetical protein